MGRFKNLGNTCYINAVLQSLTNLDPLNHELQDPRLIGDAPKGDTLYRAFLDVLRMKKGQGVVDPSVIKDCVAKTAKKFGSNAQEDAHEFFAEVLEVLSNELAEHTEDPLKPEQRAKYDTQKPKSPVATNFQMELQNSVTCLACNHTVQNQSIHRDISVDIPEVDDE